MEETQHNHYDLLQPPFQSLGRFYKSYKIASNRHDKAKIVFEFILPLILPLIHTIPELKPLRDSWRNNRKSALYFKLKREASDDIKKLKQHLKKEPDLWKNQQEAKWLYNLTSIDVTLEINPIEAFNQFKHLCEFLLKSGKKDLISRYVIFRNIQQYQHEKRIGVDIIDSYKNDLAIYKLCELTKSLLHDPIASLDLLSFGEELWNAVTYSAIQLDHKKIKLGSRYLPPIFFNHAVQEIITLKKRRNNADTGTYFTEENLDTMLDSLFAAIYKYQKFNYIDQAIPKKPNDGVTIKMIGFEILLYYSDPHCQDNF